ncbi:unnamed protein product [Effrenium voratum]|nr:unnamed protein product [Effrenium voratum]
MGQVNCCAADESRPQDVLQIPQAAQEPPAAKTSETLPTVKEEVAPAPEPAAEPTPEGFGITFQTAKKEDVVVYFTQKPLGFKFMSTKTPMTVTGILDEGCVKSKGLPVEVGWTIKAVNGKDLPSDAKQAMDTFMQALKASL